MPPIRHSDFHARYYLLLMLMLDMRDAATPLR